jgi:hypothetical protein
MNRKNIKRQFASEEHKRLLDLVEKIDELLEVDGVEEVDSSVFLDQMEEQFSFDRSVDRLRNRIEMASPDVKNRLDDLAHFLDNEFPWIDESCDQQQTTERSIKRALADEITKLFFDTSLMLYALGWNGPAIIELHSILERRALERVIELLLLPERQELVFKIFGRSTLSDLVSYLKDYGVLSDEDVKFTSSLAALRNGLAHKNITKIANAVYSGRDLKEVDIDWVLSNIDYIPFSIPAIKLFLKIEGFEERIWANVEDEES